ncbi:DNA polymerase-3 subunit epsilon [Hymenobacter gelipurpurascens]|uniref:DNA polymerase-3 subunit epsilon n=1 Tax=Hymenobacter gelipurpurascens TaxID=89968 RepID=A0A212T5B9_9BACT|nr:3'-5' exonuclease [Hymenobacter gelipurpurascens]SNC61247.1 DNA polymerase-3 subunit epsilon [Hymenobacter gelipurpurascens]
MREFLLFVDTETTGLPLRWDAPYAEERYWPHIAQLAWGIYTPAGELIKSESHYLRVPPGTMQDSALAIHGLTSSFLQEQGEEPHAVLERLHTDLLAYNPLVVGHYLQLDFHVVGSGFHRVGLSNPLEELPTFCTMQLTHGVPAPLGRRHLRLGELFEKLFQRPMERQHDAWADAQATAQCFFELQRRGNLTEKLIEQQSPLTVPKPGRRWPVGWFLLVAAVSLLLYLIYA